MLSFRAKLMLFGTSKMASQLLELEWLDWYFHCPKMNIAKDSIRKFKSQYFPVSNYDVHGNNKNIKVYTFFYSRYLRKMLKIKSVSNIYYQLRKLFIDALGWTNAMKSYYIEIKIFSTHLFTYLVITCVWKVPCENCQKFVVVHIFPYLDQIQENRDQKNSKFG